jgi:homoserine kinase
MAIGHYRKFNWAPEIKAIAIIPDFVVPTANARNVLPQRGTSQGRREECSALEIEDLAEISLRSDSLSILNIPEIKAIAIIPDFVVPTANARNVLPQSYSREDVVCPKAAGRSAARWRLKT